MEYNGKSLRGIDLINKEVLQKESITLVQSLPIASVEYNGRVVCYDNHLYECVYKSSMYQWERLDITLTVVEQLPASDIDDYTIYKLEPSSSGGLLHNGEELNYSNYEYYKLTQNAINSNMLVDSKGIRVNSSQYTLWSEPSQVRQTVNSFLSPLVGSPKLLVCNYDDADASIVRYSGDNSSNYLYDYIGHFSEKVLEYKFYVYDSYLNDFKLIVTDDILALELSKKADIDFVEEELGKKLSKTDIDTTINSNSTNDKAAGSKSVYDYVELLKQNVIFEWSKNAGNQGIPVDNCKFNLPANLITGTNPIVKRESFVANFTNPINNTSTYGECETTQYFILHHQTDNFIVFEQVITKYVADATNTFKMRRRGSYKYASGGEFNPYTDVTSLTSSDITWENWIMADYSLSNLTLKTGWESANPSSPALSYSITGENLIVTINGLIRRSNAVDNTPCTNFPVLPCKHSYNIGVLINGDGTKTGTMMTMGANSLYVLNITNDVAYFGQLVLPLGY